MKPVKKVTKKPEKLWTFPMVEEIRKYKGAVRMLATITGIHPQLIYHHISGRRIPPFDRFCLPISEAMSEITGEKYDAWEMWRPRELSSDRVS